jgi:hypothetical protein
MQKEQSKERADNSDAESETSYQGWTNYATWCVASWLMNESGSYHHWRDRTRSTVRGAWSMENVFNGRWTETEGARIGLSSQLKEEIQEAIPLIDASLYSDLLQSAMDNVEWPEIARSFIENFCD